MQINPLIIEKKTDNTNEELKAEENNVTSSHDNLGKVFLSW